MHILYFECYQNVSPIVVLTPQSENKCDNITEVANSPLKRNKLDRNRAYRAAVLTNKACDNYQSEDEAASYINFPTATSDTDDVQMEKNPAYAETQFK